jgi:Family of unknown function (DUF5519)
VREYESVGKGKVMNNQNRGVAAGGRTEEVAGKPISGAAANQAVIREVSSWEGVTVHDHRFGGVEFRVGRRELGHLHARFADLPFPRRIRDELIAAGRARPHHVLPDSGWVTVPMRTSDEAKGVVDCFVRTTSERRSLADERTHK